MKKLISLVYALACIVFLPCCVRSTNTPAEIVNSYFEAMKQGNLKGFFECAPPDMAKHLKEAMQELERKRPELIQPFSQELIDGSEPIGQSKIANVYIDGEEALVTAEISIQGNMWKVFILCQRISGTWYIADDTGNWVSWLNRLSQ